MGNCGYNPTYGGYNSIYNGRGLPCRGLCNMSGENRSYKPKNNSK